MEGIIMNLHEEIAKIAHELYEKSGWIHGRDLENWIEAEKIVKSRLNGGPAYKKQPEESVAKPPKKAAPSEAKKAVEPKKAPAKRTAKTKKPN